MTILSRRGFFGREGGQLAATQVAADDPQQPLDRADVAAGLAEINALPDVGDADLLVALHKLKAPADAASFGQPSLTIPRPVDRNGNDLAATFRSRDAAGEVIPDEKIAGLRTIFFNVLDEVFLHRFYPFSFLWGVLRLAKLPQTTSCIIYYMLKFVNSSEGRFNIEVQ